MSLWVIKIGTSLLRGDSKRSTQDIICGFCESIAKSKKRGDKIVLVTSGAVGLGCIKLHLKERPKDLVTLQAAAAIGQVELMNLYASAMEKYDLQIAQVLLTRSDLSTKGAYRNASLTLNKLLEMNVLPIINENDSLSPEELKYGDNDTLSALLASAIKADQLILLTDIDQLYSSDPRKHQEAKPISDVMNTMELLSLEEQNSSCGEWGTGGINTKLSAARIATDSGIKVQLADGRKSSILDGLLKGSRGGTVFHANPQPLASRKSWLAHAIKPLGDIYIDIGASRAIQKNGASLLLVGIIKIEGKFLSNQPVRVINIKGKVLAKGLVSMSSEELRNALQRKLTQDKSPVVIHRDLLVLTSEEK